MARTARLKKTNDPFSLPEAQPVKRLIEARRNEDTETIENCYFCHQPIEMEVFENVTFNWHCPCGKSDGFLRGI